MPPDTETSTESATVDRGIEAGGFTLDDEVGAGVGDHVYAPPFPPRDSHGWLGIALVVGLAVSAVYLATHPYPAYGAGLYLEIAEQIRGHGYGLPSHVPNYTGGLPLAYPPFMFYVAAVLLDLGLDGVTISRLVPAVVTVLYLVPYYAIADDLLPTRRQAGVATAILAAAPPTLQWHLSAGGLVRSVGFLFALTGIYAGVRVFRHCDHQWAIPGTVLFGATVLTHPVYTVFFGASWLLLYGWFDRSLRGLVVGAGVAAGGVAIASPWWTRVMAAHGSYVFTAAAGTHSGLGGGGHRLLDQFVYPFDPSVVTAFYVASFGSAVVLLRRRRAFLPVWLVAGAYLIGKERFQFVAGSMMIATVLLGVVVPRLQDRWARAGGLSEPVTRLHPSTDGRTGRLVLTGVLVLGLVSATGVATLYAGSLLSEAHHGSPSQPPFLDDEDVTAMQWAETNTDPDATFVVLGDAAEWFPYRTDRAILVGPWGVEWTAPDRYYRQLEYYETVSTCPSATCVSRTLADADVSPDYVYVPKGDYTVRGLEHGETAGLRRSLEANDGYRLAYENDGVAVFRVTEPPNAAVADTADSQ